MMWLPRTATAGVLSTSTAFSSRIRKELVVVSSSIFSSSSYYQYYFSGNHYLLLVASSTVAVVVSATAGSSFDNNHNNSNNNSNNDEDYKNEVGENIIQKNNLPLYLRKVDGKRKQSSKIVDESVVVGGVLEANKCDESPSFFTKSSSFLSSSSLLLLPMALLSNNSNNINMCSCDNSYNQKQQPSSVQEEIMTESSNNNEDTNNMITAPSWFRKTLYKYGLIRQLPLPRLLLPNDPDLTLSKKYIYKRQKDEQRIQQIQQKIISAVQRQAASATNNNSNNNNNDGTSSKNHEETTIASLIQDSFTIMYGDGMTPFKRQQFMEQYGCTGYTEEIITTLLQLGYNRGYIEIGAGNGQWARVLTDRYKQLILSDDEENNSNTDTKKKKKRFDFVLAYDTMSHLPLNPAIYTSKTQPYHDYFYPYVQQCTNDNIESIFQQWTCRGRILLLVYPPPGPMAYETIQAYVNASLSQCNDTIVYVGEGRGGANANNDFFDYLEDNGSWVVQQILPVKICGTKGYEKLFIFKKRKRHNNK